MKAPPLRTRVPEACAGVFRAAIGQWPWVGVLSLAASLLPGPLAAQARNLNELPAVFSDRLRFPVEEQAVATARKGIVFPEAPADLAEGSLAGVQPMPARQQYLTRTTAGSWQILDTEQRRFDEPVTLLISKFRFPWEDRHLDAIVWTSPAAGRKLGGRLEVRLKGTDGAVLARHDLGEPSPHGLFFSVGFPGELRGRAGALEAIWHEGDRVVGRAESPFHVLAPSDAPRAGRIALHLLNEPGAHLARAPMTVGVPFPRGALQEEINVRLVDETGGEVPLQTRVSARWSRFGAVKWLLCDFTADLNGTPRKFFLEYGPEVRRMRVEPMAATTTEAGIPYLDTGVLRVSRQGVGFDSLGNGVFQPVLAESALRGAFVQHENGGTFGVAADEEHTIEELGSEKAVLRRTGWYVDGTSGERFCQFVTRLVFHRGSPVVRIFHTWIFTGDGNRDRIRNMGWRFDAAGSVEPGGFLTSFTDGEWVPGQSLVQFDHQKFALAGKTHEGRTTGVMTAVIGPSRVSFGAKDFWQNFPSELEYTRDAFTFYNWPRHNPPASFERPVPRSKAFLHRYAHEGRLLDFRLPDEYATGPIWNESSGRAEKHWMEGRPETANAQGIARTEELFLHFAGPSTPAGQVARVLQGLNDETLRAVVDPAWVAASGAFGDIHHRDTAKYPEDEHIYEQVVHSPARWNERLGFYGMWLHGDVPAWGINLHARTAALYRALRKNHHGWPMVWVPYARSGDPRLMKYAESATRQMIDANFCHYASEDVNAAVGPYGFRQQGWWLRGLLPWAGSGIGPRSRSYTVDCDYIWDAYYLTGFARARDVALLFGELTQFDHGVQNGPRTTNSTMTSYLDMYQATFEPWFLAAAHEIARLHLHRGRQLQQELRIDGIVDTLTTHTLGHFWRPADIHFHRFTGDDEYGLIALNHAISSSSPWSYGFGGLWPRLSLPFITQAAYAHAQTADRFHLQRVAAYLDWARIGVYDGEPEYGRGTIVQGGTARGTFAGYYMRQFPFALRAFERAGYRPEPIPTPFYVSGSEISGDPAFFEFRQPEIAFLKRGRDSLTLLLGTHQEIHDRSYSYQVVGPDGRARLDGKWPSGKDRASRWLDTIELPGNSPEGVYRLHVTGRAPYPDDSDEERSRVRRRHGRVLVPAAPPEVPEVMIFPGGEDGIQVAPGGAEVQYWFNVPRDVEAFWIEFLHAAGDFNRVSVWNPGGERVWDRSYTSQAPGRVRIEVPPAHAGKLWRATGGAFHIDPRIPPYFSVSRAKWFNPDE